MQWSATTGTLAEPVPSHYLKWQKPAVRNASRWLVINGDLSLHFVDLWKGQGYSFLSFAYEVMGHEYRVTKYPHGRGQGNFPSLLEHIHILRAARRRQLLWQVPQLIYMSSFCQAPILGYLGSSPIYIHFLCHKVLCYHCYLHKFISFLHKHLQYG